MVSRTVLSAIGITVWTAVLVTAAPRAISRHFSTIAASSSEVNPISISESSDFPAESCSDLHIRFDRHDAVIRSEEKIITKAEAPTFHVNAEANGGVQVQGWDKDTYSVTLCKAAEQGSDVENVLNQIKMNFSGRHAGRHRAKFAQQLDGAPADQSAASGRDGSAREQWADERLSKVDGSLKLRAVNGPVSVRGCTGSLDLSAENGPITLDENSGKQKVVTQNGPITIDLGGSAWTGEGLDAHASNGRVIARSVRLSIGRGAGI